MRKLWILPLALFVPLLMAPSGGYPVNPTFQNVTINTAGQALSMVNAGGTFAAGTAQAYLGLTDSSAREGYIGFGGVANSLDIANQIATNGFISLTAPAGIRANSTLIIGSNITSTSSAGAYSICTDPTCTSGAYLQMWGSTSGSTGLLELSGTPVSVVGGLTLSGNSQQPVVAFDVTLQVSPTIINCLHCKSSPTAVRNSTGNYTITFQTTGTWIFSCTYRNNSSQPGGIGINSVGTGVITLLAWTPAGALSDAQGPVQCVGVS